jgi:hypothetical protein
MMKSARIFRWRQRPHTLHKTCSRSLSSTSRADRFMQPPAFLVNKNKNHVKTPEFKKTFFCVNNYKEYETVLGKTFFALLQSIFCFFTAKY